ncbi:hypothetical protein FNZ56_00960 [Pseudoluteimonas lycopersici]|uniref:Uncharacterized protein n=1 Tax=Pseudoluteimonas lycopersici TaxID=1324796 RepID=A0A516V202_9GAMM|nr:hypothetical protein [Lysobacter lycopersici]QDQ72552.1 hypothetical protein FNZ56_00960 [Lysobacter lycopersici]
MHRDRLLSMKIFQALEAEYSAIRSLNSDVGDIASRIFANAFLAAQLAPVFYSFLLRAGLSQGRGVFLIASGVSFAITYAVVKIKGRDSGDTKILLRPNADKRERLILVAFLIAFPIVVTVASVHSPWLGAIVYVLVSSIPLQRWLAPRAE